MFCFSGILLKKLHQLWAQMEKVKCSKSEAEKEDARNGSAAAGDDDDDDKPVSVHGFVLFFTV